MLPEAHYFMFFSLLTQTSSEVEKHKLISSISVLSAAEACRKETLIQNMWF